MSLIRVDRTDRIALLTLDDPGRRNAMSLPMVDELCSALDQIDASDDVACVVITGAPPAFCSGADLLSLGEVDRASLRRIYEGFLRIRDCTRPTIAAVNGPAVGAGVNLALVCDLRLAGRSARFDSRFIKLGIHPGGGHTWMLRQLIGPSGAAAMAMFNEVLDGAEAERRGLVWRSVEDDELLPRAMELAAVPAAAPIELVRRMKTTLTGIGLPATHDAVVATELEHQFWSIWQPEFQARMETLRAKRSR